MEKFTSGPWEVSNSGGSVIIGGMRHPGTIAVLEWVPLKISPEVEANAHLIAAAPLMYEALMNIRALIVAQFPAIMKSYSYDLINKAIAKADGGNSNES